MIIGPGRYVCNCHGGTLSCRTPANQWLSVPRAQHGAIPGAHGQLDPSKSALCHINCSWQRTTVSIDQYPRWPKPRQELEDDGKIMRDQFSNAQQIRKPAIVSKGGIVATQSRKAAEIGAEVLAAGGDCVDAVIATTFALGVLEPWMSGVGGGGAMVLYRAHDNKYEVIDYGMRAPDSLRAEDYPLTGDGVASDVFPWPRVKDDRNLHGPGSIAVPGVVAGMEEAHRRHARLPWQDLLAPSIKLAGEGLAVDWWTTLQIASTAADLRRYPASAAAYLVDGLPPNAQWGIRSSVRLPQDRLKAMLAHLAAQGPRDFYQGDLARSIAADVKAAGGALSVEDLAAFRAHRREPLVIPYRGGQVFATPELTGGPTLAHTLRLLQKDLQPGKQRPGCIGLHGLCAGAAIGLSRTAAGHGRRRRPARARRRASGAGLHHAFFGGRPRRQHGGGDANPAVDLRLEIRHAANRHHHEQRHHVVRPDAGRTEFAAAGKRCLTNYTPVLAQAADGRRLAFGASGGRRILPAVTQMLSFVMDYGMDLDAAIHQPRIDASEGAIVIGDVRLPQPVREALRARFDYEEARVQTYR